MCLLSEFTLQTLALKAVGVQGTIYVPKTVAASKENMLKLHDAKIVKFGNDCVETEQEAQRVAKVYSISMHLERHTC